MEDCIQRSTPKSFRISGYVVSLMPPVVFQTLVNDVLRDTPPGKLVIFQGRKM